MRTRYVDSGKPLNIVTKLEKLEENKTSKNEINFDNETRLLIAKAYFI